MELHLFLQLSTREDGYTWRGDTDGPSVRNPTGFLNDGSLSEFSSGQMKKNKFPVGLFFNKKLLFHFIQYKLCSLQWKAVSNCSSGKWGQCYYHTGWLLRIDEKMATEGP